MSTEFPEGMYCPYNKNNAIRETDNRISDLDPLFQCFDCKKAFHVEVYYFVKSKLLNQEESLGLKE